MLLVGSTDGRLYGVGRGEGLHNIENQEQLDQQYLQQQHRGTFFAEMTQDETSLHDDSSGYFEHARLSRDISSIGPDIQNRVKLFELHSSGQGQLVSFLHLMI